MTPPQQMRTLPMVSIPLEHWSRDYWLAPSITIDTYPGDDALMDYELYDALQRNLGGSVLGRVDGIHYHFAPSDDVMADRVAVPNSNHRAIQHPELLVCK